jgi:hypothetical protein
VEETQTNCIVCEEPREKGLIICGQFICADCERAIVSTDVSDERYQYYIQCMKKIWFAATS